MIKKEPEPLAPNPFKNSCPSREMLELIGGKWSILVLCHLQSTSCRTGELMRTLDGVSQKMLTQTLRELSSYGLVHRISHPEVPPRVEYSLTPLGESLAQVVRSLEAWIVANFDELQENQAAAPRSKSPPDTDLPRGATEAASQASAPGAALPRVSPGRGRAGRR